MMHCKRPSHTLTLFAICCFATCCRSAFADEKKINEALYSESLSIAENKLAKMVQDSATDDQARIALGTVQMLRGVERFTQSLYRGGLGNRIADLQMLSAGEADPANVKSEIMPPCQNPQLVSQATAVKALSDALADFAKADATLAKIIDPKVTFAIQPGRFAIDTNENGKRDDGEYLWKWASAMQPMPITSAIGMSYSTTIDAGTVHFARSVCQLMMAFDEFVLAVDGRRIIESVFPVLFPNVEGAAPCLAWPRPEGKQGDAAMMAYKSGMHAYSDYFSFVTLCCRLQITQQERMPRVLSHLELSVQQAKEGWKCIRGGVIAKLEQSNAKVANPNPFLQTFVDGESDDILAALDQLEQVLAGKRLIPHWRVSDGRGVNLRRAILESDCFEPVLLVQGTAVVPYLEKGEMVKADLLPILFSLERFVPIVRTTPLNNTSPPAAPGQIVPSIPPMSANPSTPYPPPMQSSPATPISPGNIPPMAAPVRETQGGLVPPLKEKPATPPIKLEKKDF